MNTNATQIPPCYTSPLLPPAGEKSAQAGTPPPPMYSSVYVHTVPSPTQPPRRRSRARRVFVHVFHFTVLATVFFFFFPRLFHHALRFFDGMGGRLSGQYPPRYDDEHTPPHLPHECVSVANWTPVDKVPSYFSADWDYNFDDKKIAETSLELPVSSDLLYFLSRGSLSNGVIEILDGASSTDKVEVKIDLIYHDDFVLDISKVCLLQPEEGQNGVGIFTPQWRRPHHGHHGHHHTFFAVRVKLPAGSGKHLEVNHLKTDMPLFLHSLGNLSDTVHFKTLSLSTSNTFIYSKSVLADVAEFHTSNGKIAGNFTTNDTLTLRTSNGGIVADIDALHSGSEKPVKVTLRTSNGPVQSKLALQATTRKTGGLFEVAATSSNAPVDVTFTEQPLDYDLHYDGHTSNSPIKTTLNSAYEGSFKLTGSRWFPSTVARRDPEEEDPAGKGRTRSLEYSTVNSNHVEGHVKWVPGEGSEESYVRLSTSNSPLNLFV